MSFILALIEFKFTILFYSLVLLLVYLNRKKFDVHGKFVFLYRTKFGIGLMNAIASKSSGLVKFLGSIGVIAGFAGMIFTFAVVLVLTYKLLLNQPNAAGASPVIPGLPIAGTGIVFPLVTGWLVLFVIILVHEFSHGIVASAHKIKIKNSGIAFFGPILGAFVEPDEKELSKKKHWIQHSVFAAGAFSNFLTVAAVLLIMALVLNPIVGIFSRGVFISPQPGLAAEKAGINFGDQITTLDGITIKNSTQIIDYIKTKEGQGIKVNLTRGGETKELMVIPEKIAGSDVPRIGVALADAAIIRYPWYIAFYKGLFAAGVGALNIVIAFYYLLKNLILGNGLIADVAGPVGIATIVGQSAKLGFNYLLNIIAMLSLSLAAINILPIPALDGGRIVFVILEKIFGKPVPMKYEQIAHTIGFLLLMLLVVVVTWRDVAKLF